MNARIWTWTAAAVGALLVIDCGAALQMSTGPANAGALPPIFNPAPTTTALARRTHAVATPPTTAPPLIRLPSLGPAAPSPAYAPNNYTIYEQPGPTPGPGPASAPVVQIPTSTTLVKLTGQTYQYAYPKGPTTGSIPATWYGYPTVLPVIGQVSGWLEVRLAQRPNQSVTWVRASDVETSSTPYFLVLNVSAQHLEVYDGGQEIASFPAGVGTYSDPTPTGDYFVAFQAPPPDPGYGPFVLVTSAHSDAITDWEEEGDAIIAIHGPITSGADAEIGATGAHISHGCVRLHDGDLSQLSPIPAGTPLTIIASGM